jgi:hypothetical protein
LFRGIESKPQPERQGTPSLSANLPQSRLKLCSKRQFWFQLQAINLSHSMCFGGLHYNKLAKLIFKPPAARNNFLDLPFQLNAKDKSAKSKDFL